MAIIKAGGIEENDIAVIVGVLASDGLNFLSAGMQFMANSSMTVSDR
jgi:hypothetical protein